MAVDGKSPSTAICYIGMSYLQLTMRRAVIAAYQAVHVVLTMSPRG